VVQILCNVTGLAIAVVEGRRVVFAKDPRVKTTFIEYSSPPVIVRNDGILVKERLFKYNTPYDLSFEEEEIQALKSFLGKCVKDSLPIY